MDYIVIVVSLILCFLSCHSRLGVFDWVLGRPTVGWSNDCNRSVIRLFTGMSLRGLLWTLPAGYLLYLLDFGWQYSLSGSLMGLYYYLGGIIPDPDYSPSSHFWENFVGIIPHSELMWGAFVWYVLFVSCMVELIKRRRYQLEQRYQEMDLRLNSKLFLCCANDCLRSKCISFMYQLCVMFIVVISLCSVVYYAAVEQADIPNKMQTFTGLFIGTVCLVLALGCSWGYWCGRWTARIRRDHVRRENPAPRPERYPLLRRDGAARLIDSDAHDKPADYGTIREEVVAANIIDDGQAVHMVGVRYALGVRQVPLNQLRALERMRILDYYWILFETVFYLDVFAVIHFFNGLVFALSTVTVIVMTFVCFVWNIDTQRYYVGNCNNTDAAF